MGSENVLVINPVDHSLVLPAICLVLLFFFCIYQLARLIIIILRRKKLYSAAWLIIDGHDRLEKDSRMVTVDGEILTNDFVKKQIGIGNVCQAAILAYNERAKIILPKTKFEKVTVSLAWE